MNTNNSVGFVVAVAGGLLLAGVVAGCATAHVCHVSGDEFVKKAENVPVPGSDETTRFVGIGGNAVFLEQSHPAFLGGGTVTTMYWTGLVELPTNLVTQIQAGTAPWSHAANAATNAPAAK